VEERNESFPGKKPRAFFLFFFLPGQAQHYGGVFSDGIKHHRMRKLAAAFPKDVDALSSRALRLAESREPTRG